MQISILEKKLEPNTIKQHHGLKENKKEELERKKRKRK